MASFRWNYLNLDSGENYATYIAKVPTGWLLRETVFNDDDFDLAISCSITHIPDPNHESQEKWEWLMEDDPFLEYDLAMKKMEEFRKNT